GRGAYPVRTPALFERWIFSRTYFSQDDLTVAYDDQTGAVAGFSLIGFGPDEELSALMAQKGVVCAVLVRPTFRRQGIGRGLLPRADADLRERGAASVTVGSIWPNNPYLFGLYGGSNSPGILVGEPEAEPFLRSQGYAPAETALVFQRKLDTPLAVVDTRF